MQIDDSQTVRFGAAKTISRARLDEMNASYSASYNQHLTIMVISGHYQAVIQA